MIIFPRTAVDALHDISFAILALSCTYLSLLALFACASCHVTLGV